MATQGKAGSNVVNGKTRRDDDEFKVSKVPRGERHMQSSGVVVVVVVVGDARCSG
jgi:hypothetical protein